MAGGRTIDGFLHLLPVASSHSGPETPGDLLNRTEQFFPLTDESGDTVFLAKEQTLVVTVAPTLSIHDPDRFNAARNIALSLEMVDGSAFTGTVVSELPPDRTRALDYLNHAAGFFALLSPGEIRYVNRGHIRLATPLDRP